MTQVLHLNIVELEDHLILLSLIKFCRFSLPMKFAKSPNKLLSSFDICIRIEIETATIIKK
jgi:hypothetical protein